MQNFLKKWFGETPKVEVDEAVAQTAVDVADEESGATAIEYGLIAALIAVAVITGANALGSNLGTTFNSIATQMSDANTAVTS